MHKFLSLLLLIFISFSSANAEMPHYIDFKFILNESTAGKAAQGKLKAKLEKGIKSLNQKEKSIQEEEKNLISQKKLLKPEEYKNKVQQLRKKVSDLQNQRNKLIQGVADQRAKAKSELLKNLNPIIKNYMQEKKIRMILDKKSLLLADEKLDLTKEIMKLLNAKLKSININ